MTEYDDILGLLTDLLFVLNLVYSCDNLMNLWCISCFRFFFLLADLPWGVLRCMSIFCGWFYSF